MSNVYRHYKGDVYNVIGIGKNSETQEELVFYEGTDGKLWAKPVEIFWGKVEVNGQKVWRFQHLGNFFKN